MKKDVKGLGIAGIITGFILLRILNSYGLNGRIILGTISVVILLIMILCLFVKKYYFASIIVLIMVMPIITGVIGIYMDNLYLVIGSLASFFIVIPILLKVLKNYKKNHHIN